MTTLQFKKALKLTPEQLQEIIVSKKEISDGNYSEQSELDKEVTKWANAK